MLNFSEMTMSVMVNLLAQNPLTGPNFHEWKRNLDFILIAEEHKFVFDIVRPDDPGEESTEVQREFHAKWIKSNNVAKCYMMMTMSKPLQLKHEHYDDASAIMDNLRAQFGESDRSIRFNLIRDIIECRMTEGTPVRDHASKMIYWMDQLALHGGGLDTESNVDILLNSLPKSYESFRLNVVMTKKKYTLNELLNDLVTAEGVMGKSTQAYSTIKKSSIPPKGGKKKKTSKDGKKEEGSKSKGKCFKCGKKGHWKTDCPMLKASKEGTPFASVTETCFCNLFYSSLGSRYWSN